jgi:hypothetical protein
MMTLPLQPGLVTTDETRAVRSSLDAAMDAGLPNPVAITVERGADGNIVLVRLQFDCGPAEVLYALGKWDMSRKH